MCADFLKISKEIQSRSHSDGFFLIQVFVKEYYFNAEIADMLAN